MSNTKNVEKLLKLVKTNPDLPIVAMVDNEVVGDDGYSRWMGEFGCVEVGEYTLYDDQFFTDRDEFKKRFYDNNDDALCDKFHYDPRNNENYKLLEDYLDEIAESAFIKAIIVDIDLPDPSMYTTVQAYR